MGFLHLISYNTLLIVSLNGDIEQKLRTLYYNTSVEQLVEFRIIIEGESCRLAA